MAGSSASFLQGCGARRGQGCRGLPGAVTVPTPGSRSQGWGSTHLPLAHWRVCQTGSSDVSQNGKGTFTVRFLNVQMRKLRQGSSIRRRVSLDT